MDSLHKKEARLDHDLHVGNSIHASIALQDEFKNNPREALAMIQRQMLCPGRVTSQDKNHLEIAANGDVFVQDNNRTGYYAGHIPEALRAEFAKVLPAPGRQTEAAPAAAYSAAPRPEQYSAQQSVARGPEGQPYEYQQPRQPGFHIPFPIEIGVHGGSLQLGVNAFGLAKAGVTLGAQNRGYIGSDVARTEVSAGVDLNENHIGPAADWRVLDGGLTSGRARVGVTPRDSGIDLGAGVDATALAGTIGTGAHGGVEVGRRVGPHADGYGYVGPAGVSADGYGNLSDRGLQAGADADVSVQPVVGVHGKGRVGLGRRNEAHADLGANVGDNGVSGGAGIYPQFHPDIYARAHSGSDQAGVGLNPVRAWNRTGNDTRITASDIEMGGLY